MTPEDILSRITIPYEFGACVDLRGITCEGRLVLDGARITGVDFTGAHFPEGISAVGTEFLGLSWFHEITARDVDFTDALFHNDARFDRVQIAGDADFTKAEFRGVSQFDSARIGGTLGLSAVQGFGNCSLENAEIAGQTQLARSEWFGGLWLDHTRFSSIETGDMLVHGRLWLKQAQLGNRPVPTDSFEISFGYSYV